MGLEAVVYSHSGRFGGYGLMGGCPAAPWCFGDDVLTAVGGSSGEPCGGSWDDLLFAPPLNVQDMVDEWEVDQCASSCKAAAAEIGETPVVMKAAMAAGKRKRRRAKAVKNKEDIESQRMTHIAVERNRRRQMNDYLAVLRSLMPPSYAQRGDQASIVGGAINYVRELEQLLQTLEAKKSIKNHNDGEDSAGELPSPFAGFFTFPQYSASGHGGGDAHSSRIVKPAETTAADVGSGAAIADIEASMAEGHASVKMQARRRPRQLLKLVAGLHQLGLTTLHLNMTTVNAMAMYSFSLKVGDECKLGSVEEIATAVHEILERIQEEQALVEAKTGL